MHRLTENHPLSEKIERLFAYLEDEGMTFTFMANGDPGIFINFKGYPHVVMLADVEHGHSCMELPPSMDYKLLIDKEKNEPHNG